ncbi:MAG: hypothetical protein OK452_06530 [Thaumarchaeota archaeon]|nr:hypothetical protein [Nitrososphaerota archaeon]
MEAEVHLGGTGIGDQGVQSSWNVAAPCHASALAPLDLCGDWK